MDNDGPKPRLAGRHGLPLALACGFTLTNTASWCGRNPVLTLALALAGLGIALGLGGLGRRGGRLGRRLRRPAGRRVAAMLAMAAVGAVCAAIGLLRLGLDLQSAGLGLVPGTVRELELRMAGDPVTGPDGIRLRCRLEWASSVQGVVVRSRGMADVILDPEDDDGRQGIRDGCLLRIGVRDLRPGGRNAAAWTVRGWLVENRAGTAWTAGSAALRSSVVSALVSSLGELPDGPRGLALALLLGRQDGLAEEMKAVFYRSGCAHLVALSGMHVALVALALVSIFRPRLGIRAARLGGMAGALAFIWVVGPFPSAVRALVMFIIYQSGCLLGYRVSMLACLALTGPLLSLADPRMSLDLGYLLSFWALFGILLVQAEWQALLRRGLKPWLAGELAGGLSAQFATMPLLALRGMPLCLKGFLAALVLGPLSLGYLGLSGLALATGLLAGPGGGAVLGPVLDGLYRILLAVGGLFAA
jgi:competence protein ComEC